MANSRKLGALIGGGSLFAVGFCIPLALQFDWQRGEFAGSVFLPASVFCGVFFGLVGMLLGVLSGFQRNAPPQPAKLWAEESNDPHSGGGRTSGSVDENLRRRFEQAWRAGDCPAIERYLPKDYVAAYLPTLIELVLIDFEFRMKRWAARRTTTQPPNAADLEAPRIEPYLKQFPRLAAAHVHRRLLDEEQYLLERYAGGVLVEDEPPPADDARPPNLDTQAKLATTLAFPQPQGGSPEQTTHAADSAEEAAQGDRLGRFALWECLGKGAFGAVYRAYDPQLDRQVAIKTPLAANLAGPEERERFLREARAAAQLRHPHIVQVYETGKYGSTYFIVSELVAGTNLRQELLRRGRFSCRSAAELVAKLADALDYAHRRGIVHRDMKPDNVLIDADGEPQITDFGLARRATGDDLRTVEGAILGTPAYMSPEQARGDSYRADARSDLWSLGVILYELLAGGRPFRGRNSQEVLFAILRREPDALRQLDPEIPIDLETIAAKCLAKEPDQRYVSCRELAEELGRWLRGEPILARPVSRWERLAAWRRREPALAAGLFTAAAAVLLAILVGASFAAYFTWSANRLAGTAKELEKNRESISQAQTKSTTAQQERITAVSQLAATRRKQGLRECSEGAVERGLYTLLEAHELADSINFREDAREAKNAMETWSRASLVMDETFFLPGSQADRPWSDRPWYGRFLAFAPDGGPALVSHKPSSISFWNLEEAQFEGPENLLPPMQGTEPWDAIRLLFSADGSTALAQRNREFRVWDTNTRQKKGPTVNRSVSPSAVALSANGALAALAGRENVTILDTAAGKPREPAVPVSGAVALAFLPHRDVLLVAVNRGYGRPAEIHLWNFATGEFVGEPLFHDSEVANLAVSRDGKYLLAQGRDSVSVWRLPLQERHLLADMSRLFSQWRGAPQTNSDPAVAENVGSLTTRATLLDFSADGSLAVAASRGVHNGGSLQLWKIPECVPCGPALQFPKNLVAVKFSPVGKTLLTADETGIVRRWNVEGIGQNPLQARREWKSWSAIGVSPDGRLVATADQRSRSPETHALQLWDAISGAPIGPPALVNEACSVLNFHPQGAYLVSGHFPRDATFRLWAITERGLEPRREFSALSRDSAAHFVAQGSRLLVAGRQAARLFDVESGQPIGKGYLDPLVFNAVHQTLFFHVLPQAQSVRDALYYFQYPRGDRSLTEFTPDGRVLLIGKERETHFWDLLEAASLRDPILHEAPVSSRVISPDGELVAIGTRAGTVEFFETATGRPAHSPLTNLESGQRFVWSPSGRKLAILRGSDGSSLGGRVKVYDLSTKTQLDLSGFRWLSSAQEVLFLNGENEVLVQTSHRQLFLCDLKTGSVNEPMLNGRPPYVEFLGLSPDRRLLAADRNMNELRCWRLDTLEPVGLALPAVRNSTGTSSRGTERLTFTRDRRTIVRVDDTRIASLWAAPALLPKEPALLRPWLEVHTGLRLNAESQLQMIDAREWDAQRTALMSQGGWEEN